MLRPLLTLVAFVLIALATAPARANPYGTPPDVAACITESAKSFGIAELPLHVLYAMERGSVGRVSQNKNGTVDIGPFQVNSFWLRKLAPTGITLQRLRDEVCTNVFVGTWIFYQEWQRAQNLGMAIARYHSPTPQHQARYLARVSAHLQRLIAAERRATQQRAAATAAATPTVAAGALIAGAPR